MQVMLGAVKLSGAQTIAGNKTFTGATKVLMVGDGNTTRCLTLENQSAGGLRLIRTGGVGIDWVSNSGQRFHYRQSTETPPIRYETISVEGSGGSIPGGILFGPFSVAGDVDATVVAKAHNAAYKVLIARAAASQTADLFRAEDSSKTALLRISSGGAMVHTQPQTLGPFTVATLPSAATAGQVAYASNGRVGAEGVGAGTGCPVYSKGGLWLRFDTNAQVQA